MDHRAGLDGTDKHHPKGIRSPDRQPVASRLNAVNRLINTLNAELNPICYLLALLAHHFLHVSRIRVKSLTVRLLMSYIYTWSTYS